MASEKKKEIKMLLSATGDGPFWQLLCLRLFRWYVYKNK